MKTVKYGLRNKETGVLVTVEPEIEHDGIYESSLVCHPEQYPEYKIWSLDTCSAVHAVLNNGNIEWCDATYDTPQHTLIVEDYNVVKMTTTIEELAL